MINIYYTAHEGRRNANGHTRTTGEVYAIDGQELKNLGSYSHQSGGADIECSILEIVENNGIDTNGGYCENWRKAVNIIQL